MKIVFLDAASAGDVSLEPVSRLGDLVCWQTSTPDEAVSRVADAEVLIVNKVKVTATLLDAAPKLKLICEFATGTDNIDLEAAASRNIPVRNVKGYSTDSVAQLAFSQILSLTSDTVRFDALVKDGSYSRSGLFTDVSAPYMELAGKTMGVIGMGAIGSKVAHIARAFEMKVIYYSTSGTAHCTEFPSVSKEELLRNSDIVSVHCPLTPATRGLIAADDLAMMRRSAIIVNMARGGIIDEAALVDAIDNGIIAGAAIDVYTSEPLLPDNPLMRCKHPEKLRLTPHVGWASREAIGRLVKLTADNINDLLFASCRKTLENNKQ